MNLIIIMISDIDNLFIDLQVIIKSMENLILVSIVYSFYHRFINLVQQSPIMLNVTYYLYNLIQDIRCHAPQCERVFILKSNQ